MINTTTKYFSGKYLISRIFLIIIIATFSNACAIPSSKATAINISGQLLSKRGEARVGEGVELILPAEYGLKQIDIDYAKPEELARRNKSAVTKTDSLGTFNYTFKDVSYSTSFWILPPLGNLLNEPPHPKFLMRFLSKPEATYSLSVDDNDLTYGVWRSDKDKRRYSKPPFSIQGKLIEDTRLDLEKNTISSWITSITARENY